MSPRTASRIARVRAHSDRWAGTVLAVGLGAVAAYNIVRWRADRYTASALRRAIEREPANYVNSPRVSILVAAWNEREMLQRHIESVQRLRYTDLEHIICAGGQDDTYGLAKQHERPGLIVVRQEQGDGVQGALARCLSFASGVVSVLTDADCLMDDASLEALLHPILKEGEAAATGAFRPLPEQMRNTFVLHRWAATTYRYLQAGRFVNGLTGANSALLTETLRASRAFDERVWIGLDFLLASRLVASGVKIRFAHMSEVATHFESNFTAFARQRSRWLGGILVHAVSRRQLYDIAVVAAFYAVGLGAVGLPLVTPVVGRTALALWIVGLAGSVMNRVRYLRFTSERTGLQLGPRVYSASLLLAPRDVLGLAYAPIDMLIRLKTQEW